MKILVLMAALLAVGCSPGASYWSEAPARVDVGQGITDGLGARETPVEPASPLRKVIFNGLLAIQVGDPDAVEKDVRRITDEAKGWIHRAEGMTFTLRIPASEMQATLDKLAKLGRVLERRLEGNDVTEEYRDLEIRIANAEQIRLRLIALLEKAKDVKDALEVERELGRLTEEIERMKGKLQLMTDRIAYATIVVSLHRAVPVVVHRNPGPRFPFPWVRGLGVEQLMHFRN